MWRHVAATEEDVVAEDVEGAPPIVLDCTLQDNRRAAVGKTGGLVAGVEAQDSLAG